MAPTKTIWLAITEQFKEEMMQDSGKHTLVPTCCWHYILNDHTFSKKTIKFTVLTLKCCLCYIVNKIWFVMIMQIIIFCFYLFKKQVG